MYKVNGDKEKRWDHMVAVVKQIHDSDSKSFLGLEIEPPKFRDEHSDGFVNITVNDSYSFDDVKHLVVDLINDADHFAVLASSNGIATLRFGLWDVYSWDENLHVSDAELDELDL